MDEDELEENEIEIENISSDQLQEEDGNDNYNNALVAPEDSNNTNDNIEISQSAETSSTSKILKFWKNLPPSLKVAIAHALPYVLLILALCLGIIFIATAVTAVSEELWEGLHTAEENVELFMEQAGNFFTGNGFVTNEEAASNAEKKYFSKLNEVYDSYREKYGVEIDTTLITATLFYGKGMSDYIDDTEIDELEDQDDDEELFKEETKFYKTARRQIKTLAKFQIVEESSYNTCIDGSPRSEITPKDDKDVADTWAGFFGYNSRATFKYDSYESISYPKINGSSRSIKWCKYKDAQPQLKDYYQEDYNIYKEAADKYDSCVSWCEANDCKSVDDYGTVTTVPGCTPCNPETHCKSQREEKEKKYTALQNTWGDVFDVDNGTFKCTYSSTWGYLDRYSDTKLYHNVDFPIEWIDSTDPPSSWANRINQIKETLANSGTTNCSSSPSITHTYTNERTLKREGVYYYKLMSPNTSIWSNKSFIEKYYPDEIDEDDLENSKVEIVEEIFDLYEFVAERPEYCDVNTTYTGGTTYTSASVEEFVSMIANYVVQDMQKTGVLASVTIAQAILESGHGTSGLTTKYNNYYGETAGRCASNIPTSIKGPVAPGENGNTCQANEYWDGTVVRMCNKSGADCQWYRVYSGFENSTTDHSVTFLRGNFNYCDSALTDPYSYVSCLESKSDHKYATDANYVQSIMTTINSYNLTQYDIGTPSPTVIENTTNLVTSSNPESSASLKDWLFIGDSYTDYIRGGGESWTKDYSSQEGFKVFAQAGDTTKQVYERLTRGSNDLGDSLPSSAKGIVVLAGINDIMKEGRPGYDSTGLYDVSSQKVTGTGYMKQIIEFLQSKYPNTPIYIQKVFPIGPAALGGNDESSGDRNRTWRGTLANVDTLNSLYSSLASNYNNVQVIDTRSGFLDTSAGSLKGDMTIDSIHIAPDYYDQWVSNIKNSVGATGSSSFGMSNSTYNANCIPRTGTVGAGTIPGGGAQGIRTSLPRGSSEYITYWGSNNNLYYRSSRSLIDECTWYAHGRGLEILTKNGMSMQQAQTYMDPMAHNAGTWYGDNKYFSSSTDYTKPKVGAIIVWSNGSKPGHVAIIEDIQYDSNGNIVSIATSEGGQSIGGFRYTENRTLDYIRAHGTYRFVGYVYLLG